MDNKILLQQIVSGLSAVRVKRVKYEVGIALKEMGFDDYTEMYMYKCYPYETIPASSFKNSYSKVRVAIPTINDAVVFMYSKLRMCPKIYKTSYGTQSVYKYSIGTIIPVDETKMEFFPILEHKDYSYLIEDELNDALLRMYELFKKWKKIKLE